MQLKILCILVFMLQVNDGLRLKPLLGRLLKLDGLKDALVPENSNLEVGSLLNVSLKNVINLRACVRLVRVILKRGILRKLGLSETGEERRGWIRRRTRIRNEILPFTRLQQITRALPIVSGYDELAQVLLGTASKLRKKYKLSISETRNCLHLLNPVLPQGTIDKCKKAFLANRSCYQSNKYRSADGSCNNLAHTNWGKAMTCFSRLLPAVYDDGLEKPRQKNSLGDILPNPRRVSEIVHEESPQKTMHSNCSNFFVYFSQFVDHDLTLSPVNIGPNNSKIDCCDATIDKHPECCEIKISERDSFFSQFNYRCMNMVRTATCPGDCQLGIREQINQVTALLDGSAIYGSSLSDSLKLRAMEKGRLKHNLTDIGEMDLPPSPNILGDQCSRPKEGKLCYFAGDQRVNEQPGLTVMHVLFLRHHNRIAEKLANLWPKASDQTLYEESRRIIVALLSCIVYKDFLPIILGQDLCKKFYLGPLTTGFTSYNSSMNPTLSNEFSSAGYRFGHLMVTDHIFARGHGTDLEEKPLHRFFFTPFEIAKGKSMNLVKGLLNSRAQIFNRHMTPALTNRLFEVPGTQHGMDLGAININRGRERGIAPYISYLQLATGIKVVEWQELQTVMKEETIRKLRMVYFFVDEIDLFTGGACEIPLEGGLVGPTFGFIIATDFQKLKFGDRFYFEHGKQQGSFKLEQLNEIRKKASMAMITAKNTVVSKIQQNVFIIDGPGNEPKISSFYEDINYALWSAELDN